MIVLGSSAYRGSYVFEIRAAIAVRVAYSISRDFNDLNIAWIDSLPVTARQRTIPLGSAQPLDLGDLVQ